jgi:hypothetical protein
MSQTRARTYIPDELTKSVTLVSPSGTINVASWRAPFSCTVVAVRGYRVGGTSADVNARRNGSDEHLSADLTLSSADTWLDGEDDGGATLQNTAYQPGDELQWMVTALSGDPDQVIIQVDFTRP